MIGTPIKIHNHETGLELIINDHTTDPSNVIALQTFPTFESDVRPNSTPKLGAHGEFRLPHYYSGMSIILQGVIAASDEANVWSIKDQLDKVVSLSRGGFPEYNSTDPYPPMGNSTVRLSFTDPQGREIFIDATPIKAVSYDRPLKEKFLLNFQIILRSSSPYKLIREETPDLVEGVLGSIGRGLKLSTELPAKLGNDFVVGESVIDMASEAFAVVTLNGSDDGVIVNPRITNLTNGSYTEIKLPLVGATKSFVINGAYQTMVDQSDRNVQQYSDGGYIYLSEGENTLVYTADKLIPF